MNIDSIRNKINEFINEKHYFIYCSGRGQYDKFYGYINRVYSRIFTIVTEDGKLKAISYSDYAIKNLRIQ